jgi:hypothetical protein
VFAFSLCVVVKSPLYTTSSLVLWGLLVFCFWGFSGLSAGCPDCDKLLLQLSCAFGFSCGGVYSVGFGWFDVIAVQFPAYTSSTKAEYIETREVPRASS